MRLAAPPAPGRGSQPATRHAEVQPQMQLQTQKEDNMKNNSLCNSPVNAPPDYCAKLRSGIERLKAHIQALYQNHLPNEWILRALPEAEESAWQTPFPSLFFAPLAHARITESPMPLTNT